MKGQRHCGSIKDIKMVCPECSNKYFFPIASYNDRMLDALKANGPIRISCPWCWNSCPSGDTLVDLNNPKDGWYGNPDVKLPVKPFGDLIYFDQNLALAEEFEKKVKEKFPSAKIEDGSDYIHGKRTTVDLAGEFRDEYITWVVLKDFGCYSLLINLAITSTSFSPSLFEDDLKTIKKAIEQRKQIKDPV